MKIRIAPSLLAADFTRLAEEVEEISAAGADLLHLDLMDGRFVPNLSFGPMVVRAVAPRVSIPLDAHLMVQDPDPYIAELAASGVARVAVHSESCGHVHRTLGAIREAGMEAGLTLNPATPLCFAEEALPWVDFILMMSVNPGFGGQSFIPESLDRIRRLRALMADRPIDLAVDGGVGPDNAAALVAAGATTLIAGSSVFGRRDRARAVTELRDAAAKGVHA